MVQTSTSSDLGVLCILLMIGSCGKIGALSKQDLLKEVAIKFGIASTELQQPRPCNSFARRDLSGNGFHRSLTLELDDNQLTIGEQVLILQQLPNGIFSDPYELQQLKLKHGWTEAVVIGNVDLEMPAPLCDSTIIAIQLTVSIPKPAPHAGNSSHSNHSSSSSSTESQQLSVRLPLHAKYPDLVSRPQKRESSWESILEFLFAGHRDVYLPPTLLLLSDSSTSSLINSTAHSCSTDTLKHPGNPPQNMSCTEPLNEHSLGETGIGEPNQTRHLMSKDLGGVDWLVCAIEGAGLSDGNRLIWVVPAGLQEHRQIVALGTVIATVGCAVCLIWTLLVGGRQARGVKR